MASLSELLRSKGFISVERKKRRIIRTTKRGMESLRAFPEERLVEYLASRGGRASIEDVRRSLGDDTTSIAIGFAKKKGWIEVRNEEIILIVRGSMERSRELLARASEGIDLDSLNIDRDLLSELVRRGLIEVMEYEDIMLKLTEKSLQVLQGISRRPAISRLTSELISTGSWRNYILKEYNIEAEPPRVDPGIKHFYRDFLEEIKDIMIALGFSEIRDEIIVPELWNFDALFQAQDHPAREIHDSLILDLKPSDLSPYREILEIIRGVHETGLDTGSKGWRYVFDIEKSRRLVLRSQTTAATIKYLSEHREPPQRVFIIGKVFRRDVIDAKHLPEFYQMDGIIMEKDMNLRKLMGVLTQISESLGLGKPLFKPGYFPFTEPSLEGYVRIKGLGYVEVFGAGLFRPEVLRIAGVRYNVGAWGFGIDRLAMAYFEISDIRDLYSYSLERLRGFKIASGKAFY
ncbi:MAG: phenylalanine--tRNA ligase subunit alpha [Sulfolobales archaeon]